MPEEGAVKYRAFLSYSHADTGIAKRVHARLEGFRIDKDLVGRATAIGPVPASLRPIFRDRNDFDAGGALGEDTVFALDASAALILLASPHSAKSHYVNEEVRQFKLRHPGRPLVPLIVAGEASDLERDCFPPALYFSLDASGAVTEEAAHRTAADLREEGDGFGLALAKVVASVIGLSPDEVYRRAERERRRQARLRSLVAAGFVALALIAGAYFWRSLEQAATLAEIDALVAKYSVVDPARAAPGTKESLTAAITAIAEGAAADSRYTLALALLKAGKPAEAEPLLRAVAEDKARRADKDAKDAAAAYRNLAAIVAVSEPKRAREYYAEAARLDPSDVEGLIQNGWFQLDAGDLAAAKAAYDRAIALAKPGQDDDRIIWARFGLGDISVQRGDLRAALDAYREAEALADRLARSDPGNASWQLDLSVSLEKVGNVQVAQGNLAEALKSYQSSLAIDDRLARSDPGKASWQRGLSVSFNKVGSVQVAQGTLAEALKSYQSSLAIADRLARSDPGNAGWQRDLSASLNDVGDVQVAQGNLAEALKSYQSSLAIVDRLARSDPGNLGWQRDLVVSYDKVGNVQADQGNLPEALKSYQSGLAIAARLARSDPGNAHWQRDLSVTYINVGDVQVAQGNLAEALKSYQSSLAIADRLARSDPGNAGWQHDLWMTYTNIGDVRKAQGNLAEALKSYQSSLAIADRLARSDPNNAGWQRDLIVSCVKIAEAVPSEAKPMLMRALEIANRLRDEGRLAPSDAWMPDDLARQLAALGN